jgi:hypothetical protein
MYSAAEYANLKRKYGSCASWAIWDIHNQHDTIIIDENVGQLSSNYVFVGLNISKQLNDVPWVNFRSGRHDRKLKYACNDTVLRGSYLTDLFKGIAEPKAFKISGILSDEILQRHVTFFHEEMRDIKLHVGSTLIILGDTARRYFDNYFRTQEHRVAYYCHYSYSGMTDRRWTEGLWQKLGIEQNFDSIVQKYNRSR